MMLLITCILIYQFGMSWWWYLVATAVWLVGVVFHLWWSNDEPRRTYNRKSER